MSNDPYNIYVVLIIDNHEIQLGLLPSTGVFGYFGKKSTAYTAKEAIEKVNTHKYLNYYYKNKIPEDYIAKRANFYKYYWVVYITPDNIY